MIKDLSAEAPSVSLPASDVKRRGLLRLGSLITALTGASAISLMDADSSQAGTGGGQGPTTYIPVAEKAKPSGVATLDANARIPPTQLPDITNIVETIGKKEFTGKVEAFLDPRDFANGPVTAMSSGEPVSTWGYAAPVITDGKISYTPPNNGQGGVYMQAGPFAGSIDRVGCAVELAADTNGYVVFVLPKASWMGGSNGVPAGVHNVISPSGSISHARYEAGEVSKTVFRVGNLTGIRYLEVTVDRIRNCISMYVDGVMIGEVIDPAAIPLIGNYAVWEFFTSAVATPVPAKILSLWCSSGGPARIPAALPIMAHRQPNHVGVQVKHFVPEIATSYSIPTTGYGVISPDLTMTVTFPASGKLLLSLDSKLVATGMVLLKLAASSYMTQACSGTFNGHIHASTFISGTQFTTTDIRLEGWVLSGTASLNMGGIDGVTTLTATPIESGQ